MSETVESLAGKIEKVRQLGSVVRTMKALAASSIRQYEDAVRALADYYRTVELGLSACLRRMETSPFVVSGAPGGAGAMAVIVFGSDQGLVGQFNDLLADFVHERCEHLKGELHLMSVGERIRFRLQDKGMESAGLYGVPNSVDAITPLVGDLLAGVESLREKEEMLELHLFYNSPESPGQYHPVAKRILPLDEVWVEGIRDVTWPGKALPEVPAGPDSAFRDLVSEYLFVSVFRGCAESLASENASRLVTMQRAEKNIDDMQEELSLAYHQIRQSRIDEELFDVMSGFTALSGK